MTDSITRKEEPVVPFYKDNAGKKHFFPAEWKDFTDYEKDKWNKKFGDPHPDLLDKLPPTPEQGMESTTADQNRIMNITAKRLMKSEQGTGKEDKGVWTEAKDLADALESFLLYEDWMPVGIETFKAIDKAKKVLNNYRDKNKS